MSTYDKYTRPVGRETWDVAMAGNTQFTWEYDDGRDRLLSLYQKGKDKQWDAAKPIDCRIPAMGPNPLGIPAGSNRFAAEAFTGKMSRKGRTTFPSNRAPGTGARFC